MSEDTYLIGTKVRLTADQVHRMLGEGWMGIHPIFKWDEYYDAIKASDDPDSIVMQDYLYDPLSPDNIDATKRRLMARVDAALESLRYINEYADE